MGYVESSYFIESRALRFPTKIIQGPKEKKMKNTINKEALKERLEKEGFEIKEELFDVLGLFIFEQFGIKETSKILDLTVKEYNQQIIDDCDLDEEEKEFLLVDENSNIEEVFKKEVESLFFNVLFNKELAEIFLKDKNISEEELVFISIKDYLNKIIKEEKDCLFYNVVHGLANNGHKHFLRHIKFSIGKTENNKNKVSKDICYAIWHEGSKYIKIGKTNNISRRIKQFSTSIPFKIHYEILGDSILENKLHKIFKNKRVKNEWFDVTLEEIKAKIESEVL